jgi:hypothetical protein
MALVWWMSEVLRWSRGGRWREHHLCVLLEAGKVEWRSGSGSARDGSLFLVDERTDGDILL